MSEIIMAKVYQAYNTVGSNVNTSLIRIVMATIMIFFSGMVFWNAYFHDNDGVYFLYFRSNRQIRMATWNIAAINNNPFEYWITNTNDNGVIIPDPVYDGLMQKVSNFIENPGSSDVAIHEVFTEDMYNSLEKLMQDAGWSGLTETRELWNNDYKNRKIMSEFIKDSKLGKKRLASMPDRVTNTISTADGKIVYRPTVINCFSGDLSSMDKWWSAWKNMMFETKFKMEKNGISSSVNPISMISKIKKSKYPSISEAEELISIPLQTLCCAIFDAIMVYMMNSLEGDSWQPLRSNMCNKLNLHKVDRTINILMNSYSDQDVIFLQEVAGNFDSSLREKTVDRFYDIYFPKELDGDRDQNSFILLRKNRYIDVKEVTSEVLAELASSNAPIMKGDLLALLATDRVDNTKYIFGSFHGDTNGLATIPIVEAMYLYASTKQTDRKLLFGLDANTYCLPESDQQGVVDFAKYYVSKNLNSCYGKEPNPYNFTTFHARTYLQTQLNKVRKLLCMFLFISNSSFLQAVKLEEKDTKGDKNPKDFILFFDSDFEVISTKKDNTGLKKYIENMVFPTLSFPSDHGITSSVIVTK